MTNQPEQLPSFYIPINAEQQLECTPRNTRLFTFSQLGRHAMFDHVHATMRVEGTRAYGVYLFRTYSKHEKAYRQAEEYMHDQQYPMHLNELEAAQGDIDAYHRIALGKVALDHIPEDWLSE